jgi:integrase
MTLFLGLLQELPTLVDLRDLRFKDHTLGAITAQEIDRYRQQQVRRRERAAPGARDRGLSNTSINKTLARLAQILDDAVEYGLLETNPARARRRYLPQAKPNRSFPEADHVTVLLEAAAELDREARRDRRVGRQALLATLALAGLRVGELCALRVRDVDLTAGRLVARDAKTDAGVREVDLTPALRELLTEHHMSTAHRAPDLPFFATSSGRRRDKDNVRNRVLRPALARANLRLQEAERLPCPKRSRRTRCAGRTSHCCSPPAPTPSTSCSRSATPTPRSRCASTPRF